MAYSKGKMEEAFRPGGILDKPYKSAKESLHVKREDVDLIVRANAFHDRTLIHWAIGA